MKTTTEDGFNKLALSQEILAALAQVGYEHPTPIQSMTIPKILSGKDVIGQAQTGTGKTAAFALPTLSNLDIEQKDPQVLVLTPTRELAIQVSEAFQTYASKLPRFHVQPIYGGQDYSVQLRSLRRGVHVVVGTPGRVMDHIRRGTLKLDGLKTLVLDEADEMLRMGFIDDVEWVLTQLPEKRQIALFSATMPPAVQKIAKRYLVNPEIVEIESKTSTADTVRQRYWIVRNVNKLDALTRMLDSEPFDGSLIFVRTKLATMELAEKLKARGFAAEALNGDIPQKLREKTINLLKQGVLDILVATDVAARGLDVDRITHVINYDIPFDSESYVHRIGRTGRAGRKGDAILFVSPREERMLRTIERSTKNKIEPMDLPSREDAAKKRREEFKTRISDALNANDLGIFSELLTEFVHENEISIERVAAALAKLAQGDRPLLRQESVEKSSKKSHRESKSDRSDRSGRREWRKEGRSRDDKKRFGRKRDDRKSAGRSASGWKRDDRRKDERESGSEKRGFQSKFGKSFDKKEGSRKSFGEAPGKKSFKKKFGKPKRGASAAGSNPGGKKTARGKKPYRAAD